MIYDHISNLHRYQGLGEGVRRGLEFLCDAVHLPEGRVELQGGDYANVQVYATCENNPNGYEAHRQYVDIQFLLSGEELIKVRPLEQLSESRPYDEEKDYALYHDDGAAALDCPIGNGYFVILFPNDAHEPTLTLRTAQQVKKVVVKVKLR